MNDQERIDAAIQEGFFAAAILATEEIPFEPSFRQFCEENLCGKYGANYACPPSCGTPDEMRARVQAMPLAMVLQTMWPLDELRDAVGVRRAKGAHNAASVRLRKRLQAAGVDGFLVGASNCTLCDPCAITEGKPCPHEEMRFSCMSAYCIYVRKLAERCGLAYDVQDGKLPLFGMYVYR